MMICVDLGNTSTAIGILDGINVKHCWRIMTQERSPDEYALLISSLIERDGVARRQLKSAGICSVVPSETQPLTQAFAENLGIPVRVLDGAGDWGISVRTDNPAEVGADRIANALAAFCQYGGPAIVVDIGTATTYDCISAEGDYFGGVIAPGMLAGAKDLWQKARMLPAVEIKRPLKIIGTSTVACMQSGIFYGNVGQVEGVVNRLRKQMGARCQVIMTGGWAGLIWKHLAFKTLFDPDLTLKGIAFAVDARLRPKKGTAPHSAGKRKAKA